MKQSPDCPLCKQPSKLAFIRSSDGREWVNATCQACNMAMDENDKWTLYIGGVTPRKTTTKRP